MYLTKNQSLTLLSVRVLYLFLQSPSYTEKMHFVLTGSFLVASDWKSIPGQGGGELLHSFKASMAKGRR